MPGDDDYIKALEYTVNSLDAALLAFVVSGRLTSSDLKFLQKLREDLQPTLGQAIEASVARNKAKKAEPAQ